ncbi:MD-2-related lipid-recognition protein [Eumeta japonica]|uniref:MD-2-related lipid-recognition protein n=1 Tax=Eumeta variegata TaxID=151549 RepID=A0A4C1V6Q1_EUMVA|nr:MD-2-related lipid-recognition protein [Eumeta japonica]
MGRLVRPNHTLTEYRRELAASAVMFRPTNESSERGPGIRAVVGDTAAFASIVKPPAAMGRFWVAAATLLTAIALVASELVNFSGCPGVSDECTVTNVWIDPCRENPNPCRLKKGRDASIVFDFVPKFTAQRLKTEAYWANGAMEPKFTDLDPDGCKCTACPTRPDAGATFNYTLHIGKKLPSVKQRILGKGSDGLLPRLTTISLRHPSSPLPPPSDSDFSEVEIADSHIHQGARSVKTTNTTSLSGPLSCNGQRATKTFLRQPQTTTDRLACQKEIILCLCWWSCGHLLYGQGQADRKKGHYNIRWAS